jgi:hypothetical protein
MVAQAAFGVIPSDEAANTITAWPSAHGGFFVLYIWTNALRDDPFLSHVSDDRASVWRSPTPVCCALSRQLLLILIPAPIAAMKLRQPFRPIRWNE